MHQSVSLFIGLRYLRGRAADKFGRFVSSLSAIGITLGVAALITVTSVMNGFERSLQDSILAYMPQAILTSASGNIDPAKYPISDLQHLKGVSQIAPSNLMCITKPNQCWRGRYGGIDPEESSLLLDKLVVGQRNDLKEGSYNVFSGINLQKHSG